MKKLLYLLALAAPSTAADDAALAEKIGHHQHRSTQLSHRQDELAADVQQLTIEQTQPKVIELFREVEHAMDDASIQLYDHQTGGPTLAAQTDVIEKIYEAAKQRQQSSSSSGKPQSGAMMEMLERMMGKTPGQGQGEGPPGEQSGDGSTGDSNTANETSDGEVAGKVEERRVPKKAGNAGQALPREFQEALRGYNRGAEKRLQR
jgi:hypothetical protein